ncbi:MAG: hypothetical protein K2Q22_16135, partial [Cytophagales bacterium]|nr:hypothetical protein [Cytophagales bacterium]
TIRKKKMLLAYRHVRIFRKDLRGICDSLVYNRIDSMFSLFRDPVLWNDGNQITSDTTFIHMANKKIDRIRLRTNAYTVSRDSLWNFNQAKGKNMVAYFKNNKIKSIDIRGNGESLYFALDGDTILTGMNKVLCSNMMIKFTPNSKLSTISFLTKPDGKFVPPHEISEPDKRLKGFKWREKEKPQRSDFIRPKKK